MHEKYLEQLEEAGKIRNLKESSITCDKNYVSYFLKYQGKNPEQLTCQDVRAFLLAKKDEGLKATTLNLNFHPHIHTILLGGGLTPKNEWKDNGTEFFLPIRIISKVFRFAN